VSKARKLKACDLFCGAGGTTTGAVMSGHVDVVLAINHWRVAVSSHGLNHPDTRHICAEIDNVNPREFREMGINLLLASPECVGHSNAKGDAPVDDQRRATAWCVPLATMRQVLRELRGIGYDAHRIRGADGNYDCNDASVLVERTDGMSESEVLASWDRKQWIVRYLEEAEKAKEAE
jgi:hypothetical protein